MWPLSTPESPLPPLFQIHNPLTSIPKGQYFLFPGFEECFRVVIAKRSPRGPHCCSLFGRGGEDLRPPPRGRTSNTEYSSKGGCASIPGPAPGAWMAHWDHAQVGGLAGKELSNPQMEEDSNFLLGIRKQTLEEFTPYIVQEIIIIRT